MKKLLKLLLGIFGVVTIGGVVAGAKDHLDNKKLGRKTSGIYEDCIKRGLDFICGMSALIVFWPIYLIVAILVRTKLGSPVLFTQERPGRDEKIFKLYKFRSMTDKRDANGELLPDGDRLPKFGKILRSTSLDELPEAINIVKGDMSVVGPRPLLVKYLPRYSKEQHRRHDTRPGLSGWAQVNGRNAISWNKKFEMDVWYTENISFQLDMHIIKETIVQAFIKRAGISSDSDATTEEFLGNK